MSQIVKYSCDELGGAEISCVIVKGETFFRGHDVAKVLGYKYASDALKDHVPHQFKHKLSYLLRASKDKTPKIDVSEYNAPYISEAGLYRLVFRSKLKSAEVFTDWVCSEVLPSIRKHGFYNSQYPYRRNNITVEEVEEFANGREDRLHYDTVKHIKYKYPDAIVQAGLGEHLTTVHARIDSSKKGYTSGQPDITILRGLPNGFQDVLAIELKNPKGTGELQQNQIEYHEALKGKCNIETIVGHKYDDIIIAMHEHYKRVFSLANAPPVKTPIAYDFSTNSNSKYWCNKLQNKFNLLDECKKREIPIREVQVKTNREIASILITFDKNTFSK